MDGWDGWLGWMVGMDGWDGGVMILLMLGLSRCNLLMIAMYYVLLYHFDVSELVGLIDDRPVRRLVWV
jgi:hypothetical protein